MDAKKKKKKSLQVRSYDVLQAPVSLFVPQLGRETRRRRRAAPGESDTPLPHVNIERLVGKGRK